MSLLPVARLHFDPSAIGQKNSYTGVSVAPSAPDSERVELREDEAFQLHPSLY